MADGIDYPEKGKNGDNLLRESDISLQPKPIIYSMRVNLDKGRVRIIIPLLDDPENRWDFFKYAGLSVGWKHAEVFAGSAREVHFSANSPGMADLPVYFSGHGSLDIRIFENDVKKPIRLKKIIW